MIHLLSLRFYGASAAQVIALPVYIFNIRALIATITVLAASGMAIT